VAEKQNGCARESTGDDPITAALCTALKTWVDNHNAPALQEALRGILDALE